MAAEKQSLWQRTKSLLGIGWRDPEPGAEGEVDQTLPPIRGSGSLSSTAALSASGTVIPDGEQPQQGNPAEWDKSSLDQDIWAGADDGRRLHLEGGVTEPVPVEATPDAGDMEIEGQASDVVLQPDPLSHSQTVGSPTVEISVGQRIIRNREQILAEAPAVKQAVQEILGKYESQIPNDPETQEFVSQLESLSHSIDSFVGTLNENPDEAKANEASAGLIENFLDFIQAFEATKTGDTVIRLAAGTVILALSRWFADDVPAALTFSLLAIATYPQESKNIASAIASICKIGKKGSE